MTSSISLEQPFTEAGVPAESQHDFPRLEPRGYVPRKRKLLTRAGYYGGPVSGSPSTTRQVEILNPAVLAAPMQFQGLLSGVETLSKTPSINDPFEAYKRNQVDSPNVCELGDVGVGKSTLMKCDYVLRPLTLKQRRVVVIDIKQLSPEDACGEYTPVAEAVGVEPIRFALDDPTSSRLNLLDPALRQTKAKGTNAGALQILQQATVILNDDTPLDTWDRKALRSALSSAQRDVADRDREITIHDVLDQLGNVDRDLGRGMTPAAQDRLHMAGMTVRFILERLPEELPGLFDTDTSRTVTLGQKATFFDFSQLPDEGPARSIGMMLANAWTLGTIKTSGSKFRTNFCVDEGWFLVGGPMGKVIRSNAKLSRALGMSNVVNIHHVSDIPVDDPAIAFIKEAGTLHLFRQSKRDDADAAAHVAGLNPGAAEQLMTLPKGQHFKKVGLAAEVRIAHYRSALEERITDTSRGLTGDPA